MSEAGAIATLTAAMELDTSSLAPGMNGAIAQFELGAKKISGFGKEADLALAEAGRGMGQLRATAERLRNELNPLREAELRYGQALKEIDAMVKTKIVSEREAAAMIELTIAKYDMATGATQRNTVAQVQNTASNGMARAGLQQLAMNLSDMTTMWSLGAKGSQIFGSQIGQVIQSVQLLTGGTGKFAAFMANPWVMAITYGTMILGPLAGALLDTEDATKKVEFASYELSDAQSILGQVVDLTTGKLKNQTGALVALARAQAVAGQIQARAQMADATSAMNAQRAPTHTLTDGPMGLIFGVEGKQTGAVSAFQDGTLSIQETEKALRSLQKTGQITEKTYLDAMKAVTDFGVGAANLDLFQDLEKALDGDTGAMDQFLKLTKHRTVAGDKHAETLLRESAATEAQIKGLFDLADAYGRSDAEAMKAEIAAKATSDGIKKRADVEGYVSQQVRLAVAQRVADGAKDIANLQAQNDARQILNNQVKQGLITSEQAGDQLQIEAQLRPLIAAQALAEGDAKERLIEIIRKLRGELARQLEVEKKAEDLKQERTYTDQAAQTEKEIELTERLGKQRLAALTSLKGDALEDELARINHEMEVGMILLQGQAQAAALDAQGLHAAAAAALKAAAAKAKLADVGYELEKGVTANERLNEQLAQTYELLQSIGGAAGMVGHLLQALQTGNYSSAFGTGALGQLVGFVLEQKGVDGKKVGEELKKSLEDLFDDVFGKSGIFGKTLEGALKNAGMGMAAGDVAGIHSTGGKIGSGIGGAIGGAIGAQWGPLGELAGSFIGGLIGGGIGSIFGGSKKGSVTLSGTDITDTRYHSSQQLGAATDSADSIIDSLNRVADALGGTLGSVSGVSIGMRNDSWRVDPTGQGRVKGSGVVDFGDDAEAAAAYAMKLLIERGVIEGIHASTQNVLLAGKDLETQINKAIAWENILKEAEGSSSSFSRALEVLKNQFDEIGEIALEAKASTQELAEVQALLIKKQQELIDQAMSSYRSTFYTDAENVAYAKGQISKTLTPLGYGSVDTVDEYKALVAATDPLKDPELFGALMDLADEFGVLKDAADNAAQAAEQQAAAEKQLAQQRESIRIQILQAQGKDAEAQAAQRAADLAAADESVRPLLKELYRQQDIAEAKKVLSDAYDRESSALQDTIDANGRLIDNLKQVRAGIFETAGSAGNYAALLARLRSVGRAAALGDKDAAGQLGGAIDDFLPAAKARAGSLLEFQRAQALAARYADSAIGAAEAGKSVAEEQLAELKTQVGALVDIDKSVVTVREAIDRLAGLGQSATQVPPQVQVGHSQREHEDRDRRHRQRLEDVLDRIERASIAGTFAANKTARTLESWDRGDRMATEPAT